MKITIKKTEEQLKLLSDLASRDKNVAMEAQAALSTFMSPIIEEVINNASTLANLFETKEFDSSDNPSIALDLYTDVTEGGYLTSWMQNEDGGLASNNISAPTNELKLNTYNITSAISFNRKYAKNHRLDVVAKAMQRLAQEILMKRNVNAAAVLLTALAKAKTKINATTEQQHVFRTHTAGQLIAQDIARLDRVHSRIRSAWNYGTPDADQARGLTDLIVSLEVIEKLKGLVYEPWNIKKTDVGNIPAPEAAREEMYRNGGVPNLYGINIFPIHELGIGYKFNEAFSALAGSKTFPSNWGGSASDAVFNKATQEIAIGIDRRSESLIRPTMVDDEIGSAFVVEPDDQFVRRSNRVGFFGQIEEGYAVIDDRAISGLII